MIKSKPNSYIIWKALLLSNSTIHKKPNCTNIQHWHAGWLHKPSLDEEELILVLPSADQLWSSAGEKDAANLLCLLEEWLAWTSEAKGIPQEPKISPGEQSSLCTHPLAFQSVWPNPENSRIPPGPVQMATLKQRCRTFWSSREQHILSCRAVSHSWCFWIATANTARNPRNQIFALIL